MSIRIEDVARESGFSTATVSRALSGEGYVNKKTKEKILQVVKRLNYSPNALARGLVRKKTNVIGLVVSDISMLFYAAALGIIETYAASFGLKLMLCNVLGDIEKEKAYLKTFIGMRVDGIIIMHEQMDEELHQMLTSLDTPVVCSAIDLPGIELPTVVVNDELAAYDAVKYIVSLGHKDIAFFGSCGGNDFIGKTRTDGYSRALKDFGLEFNEENLYCGSLDFASGYKHMQDMLGRKNRRPTAVFAGSDDLAIGAISCAKDNSVNIPEEISIIGFDNSKMTPFVRPALTTVSQSFDEIGRKTIEMLVKYINDPTLKAEKEWVSHSLEIRKSCAPVKVANNI